MPSGQCQENRWRSKVGQNKNATCTMKGAWKKERGKGRKNPTPYQKHPAKSQKKSCSKQSRGRCRGKKEDGIQSGTWRRRRSSLEGEGYEARKGEGGGKNAVMSRLRRLKKCRSAAVRNFPAARRRRREEDSGAEDTTLPRRDNT